MVIIRHSLANSLIRRVSKRGESTLEAENCFKAFYKIKTVAGWYSQQVNSKTAF